MAKNRTLPKIITAGAGFLLFLAIIVPRVIAADGEPSQMLPFHEKFLQFMQYIFTVPELFWLLVLVMAAMIVLPFYAAIRELLHPRDIQAQTVDMEYTKEFRYFERAFLEKLCPVIGDVTISDVRVVMLSKTEKIEVSGARRVMDPRTFETIVYVNGDIETGVGIVFEKELIVAGSAQLGHDTLLRAISVRGSLTLGRRASLSRWAGADGDITAGDECILGVQVVSGKTLLLGQGCLFKSLSGAPIQIAPSHSERPAIVPGGDIRSHAWYINRDGFSLPPGVTVEKDIIAKTNIVVGAGSRVRGSITASGTVGLEAGAVVEGSIFAESGVLTAQDCRIGGDIFSQHQILLGSGTIVGEPGSVRSVIGKDKLFLSGGVIIYGTAFSERDGEVIP
ncbi:MAG: polymer-forming cytoskeletal protein [Elusimicrobia bacterium]|nr:polymer-forming cytoskeletal protein [Elusimicrobiota bacterium]